MSDEVFKIRSFTGLLAWQHAHKLAVLVYKMTKKFPKEEMYGLVSQIRRCAVSVSSNLAEGFSRLSNKEKIQFYHIALGSLTEFQNQWLISRDVGYINEQEFISLANKTVDIQRLIHGLIRSINKRAIPAANY